MCQVLLITHMLPPSCSARNGFVILLLLSYLSVAPYLLYTRIFLFLNLGAWSLELGQERRILCPSPAAVIGFS